MWPNSCSSTMPNSVTTNTTRSCGVSPNGLPKITTSNATTMNDACSDTRTSNTSNSGTRPVSNHRSGFSPKLPLVPRA